MSANTLFYGDNLDVLRRHVQDESVDLVYLDPPFKSDQDYNVLFAERDGSKAAAQIRAFEDTWRWDQAAARAYQEIVENGDRVSDAMRAFRAFLGESDMLAYLAMMAPRLVELRRVMRPAASIYLHCDPTASHFLKMLMDAAFGPQRFRSEIIWKRSSAHSGARRYSPVHDTLLFYSKGEKYTWNPAYQPLPQETADAWYNNVEDRTGRRFNRADLTAAGVRSGPSGSPWRAIDPSAKGRHWAVPGFVRESVPTLPVETDKALDALDAIGRLHWPKKSGGTPMLKRYLDEARGIPALDVITDIAPLNNVAAERLGYPTQKPEALLERIVAASSNVGDVVLDPFCGCGTAVAVAERLGRQWLGIDITHLAVGLVKSRLQETIRGQATFEVRGEPVSIDDARALAAADPHEFQCWALGLVGARPAEVKKGADRGVDGKLFFFDDPKKKERQIIFSVKAGHATVSHVRDLRGVIERDGAQIGALISIQNPTQAMRREAASAGFYTAPSRTQHPRLQLLTIADLLAGSSRLDYPPARGDVTYAKAPPARAPLRQQHELFEPASRARAGRKRRPRG